jgi:hypothetical protein
MIMEPQSWAGSNDAAATAVALGQLGVGRRDIVAVDRDDRVRDGRAQVDGAAASDA